MKAKKYVYNPSFLDRTDPRVIAGYPIKLGAVVTITKSKIDPLGLFVFIQDSDGNRQSVYRSSLTKCT